MAHIILYAEDFSHDVWKDYCNICYEDPNAISLTITFDEIKDVKAEYEDEDEGKGYYEVCVMGEVTYNIEYAESEEDAIMQAIDLFKDDDEYYGTEKAENVTENDCEIVYYDEV